MRFLRVIALVSLLFGLSLPVFAQTFALLPDPRFRGFDINGIILPGGKVCTYQAGTTTPLATYTDSTGITPNANPVILDSQGYANIWLSANAYKIVLLTAGSDSTCSTGVQQWSVDNVSDIGQLLKLNAIISNPAGNASQSISGPLTLGSFGFTAGAGTFSSVNNIIYAAPNADGGVSITAAISSSLSTGGTVNTCLLNSTQAVTTPINVNKSVKIQQCGGQTLQLANGAGITITSAAAEWTGNSPAAGSASSISAQSIIQAQTGFIGALMTVTIGAGVRNGGISNLGIDCKNEAGVTAGLAYTATQQNWGVVHDVAIGNCPGDAFQLASGVGSMRFDRIFTNNVGTAFNAGFASDNDDEITNSRLLFNTHGIILGSDDVISGNNSSSFSVSTSDISNTNTAATEHILVRNARGTRIIGNRIETLAGSTLSDQIVLGTATPSTPNGVVIMGNFLAGGGVAAYSVKFQSVLNPLVMGNISDNLTTRLIHNVAGNTGGWAFANRGTGSSGAEVDSVAGMRFVFDDSTTANPQLQTALGSISTISASAFLTQNNCQVNSVSPAACGSASSGAFVVPTTTTTYTVNTTAVTAASRIFLFPTTDASNLNGPPTCVAPAAGVIVQSARVAATSFTFTLPSTAGTTCFNYLIIN